jgi:hypothetical protein
VDVAWATVDQAGNEGITPWLKRPINHNDRCVKHT